MPNRLFSLVALAVALLTVASCRDAGAPNPPRTIEASELAVDHLLDELNWALRDCYEVGCRALIVAVQVDTAQPQHVWRVRPR